MSLSDEMQSVISNLESRRWIQGVEVYGNAVCAHGAVKTCETLRPGDEQIIRAVMRRRGLTEGWNDEDGRTKAEVLARMRQIEVSDADLADTFGPNWWLVIAVVRRAAILTRDEVKQLAATRRADESNGVKFFPHHLIRCDMLDTALRSALNAARNAARTAEWYNAWNAARCAKSARSSMVANVGVTCVVADLVGQRGFTQKHIDTLMKPWVDVLGEDWAEGMLS
jgi:hypothetical protein